MTVTPYLFFKDNCEEALHFYEQVAGARIGRLDRYESAPAGPGPCPPELGKKIINASLRMGGHELMASDCPPGQYFKPQGFALALGVEDAAAAKKLFDGLAAGGQITMPLAETFFAHAFGMLTDKFGQPWMVVATKAPFQS